MKRYLRDIQARAIVDLIWIPVRLGVRIRDRSLLWPCSLVQLRSHFPILGDQWSLLGGDAGKRSMASIWASWPFNPPSLPPTTPSSPSHCSWHQCWILCLLFGLYSMLFFTPLLTNFIVHCPVFDCIHPSRGDALRYPPTKSWARHCTPHPGSPSSHAALSK